MAPPDADESVPALVTVWHEGGRIEQRTGWAKAWTAAAEYVRLAGGYLGWWPASDVKRMDSDPSSP